MEGLPLPVGKYRVKLFFFGEYRVQISEGKTSELNPMDSAAIPGPPWRISDISNTTLPLAPGYGRLNTYFPGAHNIGCYVWIPNPGGPGHVSVNLDSLKSIDLLPGTYHFVLNSVPMDLPVQSGKETNIRFGILKTSIADTESWRLFPAAGGSGQFTLSSGSRTIALPVGFYKLSIGLRAYLININEFLTVYFNITNPSL